MSVYKSKRRKTFLLFLQNSYNLRKETIRIIKKFPTSYRWIITNNMLKLAGEIFSDCLKANEESLLIKKEITEELLNVPVTKRFSDIATGKDLPIDNFVKVKIDSILNKEMTLLGFEIFKSKFNKGLCTVLKFIDSEGHKVKVFTGSHVLENQCRKYIDEMPFITKLIKTDKYYSFS